MSNKQTRKHRERLFKEQSGLCYWCKEPMTNEPGYYLANNKYRTPPDLCTIEHLTPTSEGGTNEKQNLAVACFSCNTKRNGTNPSNSIAKSNFNPTVIESWDAHLLKTLRKDVAILFERKENWTPPELRQALISKDYIYAALNEGDVFDYLVEKCDVANEGGW